jgi:putative ABC transport system ATP-binding protein
MASIVTIENLKKAFGKRMVLDGLSLSLPERSLTAIVGASGSGKSTLLNIIGLLEEPTAGSVRIAGKQTPAINSRGATLMRRNTINYLFQSNALVNNQTVLNNILIALHYSPLKKDERKEQVSRVLKDVGLEGSEDTTINVLSGGEQQRVAIARCILKPGDLVLADEPTGSLDRSLAQSVFNKIVSMRDVYGKTVVNVTHDLEIANRCDNKVVLSEGTLHIL